MPLEQRPSDQKSSNGPLDPLMLRSSMPLSEEFDPGSD